MCARLRRYRIEATRFAIPLRPHRPLDQGQEPGGAGGFDNRQQRSEPRCPFAQCACDRPCRPLPGTNRTRAPIRRECGLTVASWPKLPADSRRRGRSKKQKLASLCGTRRAGAGAFCTPRLPLNGGQARDNERCGECSVFWCVPHKGCGRGYSRSYPACNRKPRHCLSPNEGRSFALPRHAQLHRAAGLFRISERGVEGESRGSRKGEDGQCAITLGAGCPCDHFGC